MKAKRMELIGSIFAMLLPFLSACHERPPKTETPGINTSESGSKCVIDVISEYKVSGLPRYSELVAVNSKYQETDAIGIPKDRVVAAQNRGWQTFEGPRKSLVLVNNGEVWRMLLRGVKDLCVSGVPASEQSFPESALKDLGYSVDLLQTIEKGRKTKVIGFNSAFISFSVRIPPDSDGFSVGIVNVQTYHNDEELRMLLSGEKTYDELLEE